MKQQIGSGSILLRYGKQLLLCCLLGSGIFANAQETRAVYGFIQGKGEGFRTAGGGHGAFFINGSDIGTILLKTCDLDTNGAVTSIELDTVASASFQLWDTNSDSSLNEAELSTALKALFPKPMKGEIHAVRVINGVPTEVAPEDLPTPDKQICKRTLAGADANQDGLISSSELSAFLDQRFSVWDQDANGSLSAEELNTAFFELSRPDEP